jgi:hypothetical protein
MYYAKLTVPVPAVMVVTLKFPSVAVEPVAVVIVIVYALG